MIYDITIKSYSIMNIDINDSIQNNFAEIWALKVCNLYATLWAIQEANGP